jgi:tetratricopeptide (TPR) repeat protein
MIKFVLSLFAVLTIALTVIAQPPETDPALAHFQEGLRLLRDQNFEAAVTSFEKSAAIDPKRPETFANIGSALIALKRFDKAEAAFRSAIRLSSDDSTFRVGLCQSLSLQKKHTEALAACVDAVRLDPNSDRAQAAQLIAMESAGHRIEDMQRAIDNAVGRFRNSEAIMAMAADFYLFNGNRSYALSLFESLVSMRPDNARYHGSLAEIYLLLGRDTDALSSARTALRLAPLNPYANYAMGLIFYELGQHEEAAESFRKARSDDRRLKNAAYYLAMSESRRGRHTSAISLLRELTAQYPKEVTYQYQLGQALSDAYLYAEAEIVYSRVNDLRPGDIDVISALGMAYMLQAKFDKAIVMFEQAVRMKPDNEHYKMLLGAARARQAIAPQIPAMIHAVEENPKDIKVKVDLVRALAFALRIDEAQRYVDEIYELDPADDRIYQILGVSFADAGRLDKSLDAYKRSLVKKENPAGYLGLAGISARRGDFESASAAYAKVIELKPDTPNIMKLYADLLRDNGRRREALDMYRRSLAILPNNGPALYNAGILSLKLGDRDSANGYLGNLRNIDPQLAELLARCVALRLWD